MNLEQKYLNDAAAELFPIESDARFMGPSAPPEAGGAEVEFSYELPPESPEEIAGIQAGRRKPASVIGMQPSKYSADITGGAAPLKQFSADDINKLMADPSLRFNTVSEQMKDIFNREQPSELISLDRTMREELSYQMQQTLIDKFGIDNYKAGRLADTLFGGDRSGAPLGLGLIDVTPFTIPLAMQEAGISAGEAKQSFERGDYGQAALEYGTGILQGAEAVPAVKIASKMAKGAAEALGPTAANMMEAGMRKTGMIADIVPEGSAAKAITPTSDIGFYSAVEKAATNVQRKTGSGESFLNDLMKAPEVREDEIKWIGLDDFLKSKKTVTKQEIQDYIADNKVDVQEVKSTIPRLPGEGKPGDKGAFLPRHAQYQFPGGENYRELLLTIPQDAKNIQKKLDDMDKEISRLERAKDPRWRDLSRERGQLMLGQVANTYKSTHFDQPNILAHIRVNDRVDADGKKMLLIEEVQSDWHQAGRKKGYQKPDAQSLKKEFYDYAQELSVKYNTTFQPPGPLLEYPPATMNSIAKEFGMQPDEVSKYLELQDRYKTFKDGVPDAPFKDTWYQLALKRAIQFAAENGYERIGITTGKQQIDRYSSDIRKNVDKIKFFPVGTQGETIISAVKNNKETFNGTVMNGKFTDGPAQGMTIEEVLGKSMSKKIMAEKDGVISGDDLAIGGEGMKQYYDKSYPEFLAKYGKKWNAKLGDTKIQIQTQKQAQEDLDLLEQLGEDRSKFNDSGMIKVRYIDITPEMKAGVSKGQPLFQAIPAAATTGAATMQENEEK
jgi:hypothetical protein